MVLQNFVWKGKASKIAKRILKMKKTWRTHTP